MKFQVEPFDDVIHEAEPLLKRHWEEIARHKDCIPLSPNLARYAQMDANGSLAIFTARHHGRLVGYAAFIVDFLMHYSTIRAATADAIWVEPEARRVGAAAALGLVDLWERTLADQGVCTIRVTAKTAHPALSRLLSARGYDVIETTSEKLIQRPR